MKIEWFLFALTAFGSAFSLYGAVRAIVQGNKRPPGRRALVTATFLFASGALAADAASHAVRALEWPLNGCPMRVLGHYSGLISLPALIAVVVLTRRNKG